MVEVYAEKTLRIKLNATLIFVTKDQVKNNKFNFKNSEIEKQTISAYEKNRFKAEFESILTLNVGKPVFVIGLGNESELTSIKVRIAVKHFLDNPLLDGLRKLELCPHQDNALFIRAYVEGCVLGNYKWDKYLTKKDEDNYIIKIVSRYEDFVWRLSRICDGVNFARDLVNENADIKNSEYIEQKIRSLIKRHKNTSLTVIDEKKMKKLGMNLFLAVNKGSNYPPKLIIIEYHGGQKHEPYVAFLGKGITFDSGGINLKPSGYLESMRFDMAGTAAVIGTLRNILELKPQKNIIFACALAENAIGKKSYKPGDVYTAYNKKTVEIANTDAEGRLILADSLAYITEKYHINKIIDIATLTGAVLVSFGNDFSALMTTNQKIANDIIQASHISGDRAWQMPIYPELKNHVKSKYADIRNLGFKGKAGTLSAGEFLRQFVKKGVDWAHLDIAGTAYIEEEEYLYYNYGATGAGVRLMTDYLTLFA